MSPVWERMWCGLWWAEQLVKVRLTWSLASSQQLTRRTISQRLAWVRRSTSRQRAAMPASFSSVDPVSRYCLGIALGLKWTPRMSQPKYYILAHVSILGTFLRAVNPCFCVHWQTFPAYYASMPWGPRERRLPQAKQQCFLGHFTHWGLTEWGSFLEYPYASYTEFVLYVSSYCTHRTAGDNLLSDKHKL